MGTTSYRFLPLLLSGLLLAIGCGGPGGPPGGKPGGAQQFTVTMNEFKFEPANLTVRANQPVQLTVRNTGSVVHDWVVQGLDPQPHAKADPGQTATVQFTPNRTGSFRIICAEPGHEPAGMVGRLTVQQ